MTDIDHKAKVLTFPQLTSEPIVSLAPCGNGFLIATPHQVFFLKDGALEVVTFQVTEPKGWAKG